MKRKEDLLALLDEGKWEEAHALFFGDWEGFYQEDPAFSLDTDLVLRLRMGEYGECYEDLERFQGKPYVSIAFEERLLEAKKRLKERIRKEEERKRKSSLPLSLREGDALREGILALDEEGLRRERPFLRSLAQEGKGELSLLALLSLMRLGDEEAVLYRRDGREWRVLPKDALPPLMDESFLLLESLLEKKAPSPSHLHVMEGLLRPMAVLSYPELPFLGEEEEWAEAALLASRRMLGEQGEAVPPALGGKLARLLGEER